MTTAVSDAELREGIVRVLGSWWPSLSGFLNAQVTPPELFANEPDIFDMQHAADLLGVTKKTIQREISRGRLRSIHVGSRVRITKQALVEYIQECEVD